MTRASISSRSLFVLVVLGAGLAALGPVAARAEAPSADERVLLRAYQKEYAFLESQRRALQKRLAEVKAKTAADEARQAAALDELERGLLADQIAADRLEDSVRRSALEQDAAAEDEGAAQVLEQIESELRRAGVEPPFGATDEEAEVDPTEAIGPALTAAVDLIERDSELRREAGTFFDTTGRRVEGQLVHLGGVATFGVADDVAGALAPAGGGAFKLWPEADAESARALASGQMPPQGGVLLYESADKAVEAKKEKTALEIVESGGAIAWVIVGLGSFALLLVLSRALLLLGLGLGRRRLLDEVLADLKAGRLAAARARCRDKTGAMARVLHAATVSVGLGRGEREDRIDEAILRALPRVDRFGPVIVVVAAVAPLLGLLGTVTGMIATFDVITEHGTGDPRMLSGGISEALVTTELGLIVAIPSLLLGNLLLGWGERIKRELEIGGLAVVNASSVEVTGWTSGEASSEPHDEVTGLGLAAPLPPEPPRRAAIG